MSGPAMGSFAMGHWGIMTTGLYIVDKRPCGLTGLLSVITAVFTERISTNTHTQKYEIVCTHRKKRTLQKKIVFADLIFTNLFTTCSIAFMLWMVNSATTLNIISLRF